MKKVNIFIWIGIGIVVIISGWLIFFNLKIEQPVSQEETVISQEQEEEKEVVLVVDDGKEPKIFNVEFIEGITAFDLLKEKAEESGLTLKTKTYDIGILIEAVGDKENGQEGKYWLYYVNGEMPMVSADKKELKPDDKVEFKFEKSPF